MEVLFSFVFKSFSFEWPNFLHFLFVAGTNNSEGRRLLRTQYDRSCSLFYVELPGGTILTHVVEENERFPSQFGREVRC